MKFIKQRTLSSCGPTAIYNFAITQNKKYDLNHLKKRCKTDKDGTDFKLFKKVLKSYFSKIKHKENLSYSEIKKIASKKSIIIAFDYRLNDGTYEGHFSMILKSKRTKLTTINNYLIENAEKLNKKNMKGFKTFLDIDRKEFKKYKNVQVYYL